MSKASRLILLIIVLLSGSFIYITIVRPQRKEPEKLPQVTPLVSNAPQAIVSLPQKETEVQGPKPKSRPVPVQPDYKQHIAMLMEDGNPLHLTPWQKESIQTAYNSASEERQRVEARIATVDAISTTETYIEIPKYTDDANRILKKFDQDVHVILGDVKGPEFAKLYDDKIRELNNGFGTKVRKIMVDNRPDPDHLHIVETILTAMPDGAELKATVTSELRRGNLVQYAHLKDLFPK